MKKNRLISLALGATLLLSSCSKDELPVPKEKTDSGNELMTTKATTNSNLILGITGQPLSVAPYFTISAAEQIGLLKKMGMSIYRFGVESRIDNGSITVPYLYTPLKKAADTAGITLLPMLKARTLNFNVNESASYRWGRALAAKFASRYKDDFTYYQIGNELDNICILPGRDGTKVSHYHKEKFKIIAAYLKGMNDGIKAMDKDAKTIINAGWMHYQYLLMLQDYGISFDIIGYQWYSEMDLMAEWFYNIPDITKFLSSKFSKPIWITEFNLRNSFGSPLDEFAQQLFITSFINKCRNNPQVQAAVIYELFDQPQRYPNEAHYGIFKWQSRYSSYLPKLFARQPAAIADLVR